ncbi:uncharacterized protein LOC119649465 isoform X16 [Hermetia illucens]|uniref:uncharacterized protein LOC119649465 isoform X16 n=1 Tax=Hermetia illucens TaxID=343691 RepID=UPI0018CC1A76|nr:uncharacterized protein LOC119649465 isoform X16 [Hermetia illucens]
MPKHRRRKNQRRLDSKSIKNSQLKNQQLKQLHRDEQAAGDIEQKDRKDSQNEDCLEERYSEEEVEAPADVSNTSCSPADKCGNENLTIDAATAEISGTEPTEIQTLADPDVAGGECCQQHQLTSSAESTCAISEDIIDDQKSSCPYFSDTQADDQVSTTDSTQSVISAAGQPSANNLPSPVSSENVETEIPNATVDLDPAVTGTAPSDDLSTLDLSSTIREPRSHSFSESADTSTLKDESGTGGGSNAGDPTAQSPQPSPDNEISDNQTATTCDITATTTTTSTLTTTTATTKALTGINDQLICDNASETKIDQTIATSREDKHVGENIEEMYSPSGSEAECNQEFSHLETNQSAVASAPARNVPTLSDAVSVISNKIAMLCDEITSAVSQPKNDETDSKPVIMEEAKVSCEVNEQLSEAKDKVESSPSPNVISDSSKSQAGPIDEHQRVLDNPNATPVDTIDTEIIKSISADSITDQMNIDAQDIPAELMKNVKAPTRHPIVQEVITILYPSRVESPKPLRPKRAAYPLTKSKSLDDDDIMIQEMNDASSMGDINENQPMISEASESGTDTDTAPTEFEEKLDPRILSIQTLPLESSLQDHIENNGSQQQPTGEAAHDKKGGDSQDTKARRARNRAALEMHFFPQFLNPRYLDSIKEENSDTSDLDSKSPVRERSSSSLGDLEDDVFSAHASNGRRSSAPATPTTPSTPKADTVFPKSHLDFSHMRKHGPSLRSPQTSVIREESPCYVVETKIIEPPEAVEERCSEWTTKHVATSTEGAEVVYIDSASSSSSDLMELDYTDSTVPGDTTEDESSETIHIETPTIEENEDAANIFGDLEKTPTREIPDTIPETSREVRHFTTVTSVQKSITIQKKEHSERFFNNQELNQNAPQNPLSTDHEKQDNHQQPVNDYTIQNEPDTATIHFPKFPESSSAQNDGVTSDDPSLSRERLSCISNAGQSAVERETLVNNNTSSTSGEQQSTIQRPDFKIGEPCSNNMFATFLNSLIGSNSTNSEDPSQTSSSAEANKQVTGETSNDRGELVRQDSSGSHCSGQSQTTVINRGPPSQTDLADFDIGPCVSGSSNEFAGTEYTYRTVFTYSPKGLRQLCLELLASMPYGNIVLEELASVSESINDLTQVHQKFQELKIKNTQGSEDMPYPLPELPKISDLVVPNRPDVPSHVKLMAAPPTKLQSPPPPPVPDRPKMEEAWLGVPTDQDPSVLVCLSPAQRDYINNSTQSQKSRPDPTPDNLLDMHRKFVERRGYHELPSQLVDKIDRGKSSTEKLDQVVSSTQLRKSTSPPPIPPPPAADLLKEYDETQTKANVNSTATQQSESDSIARGNDRSADGDLADKNNHRLLAIIRDSQQALSSDKQTIQEKVEHQTIVNKSQRTSHTQTQTGPGPEITPRSSDIKDRQPPEVPPRFSTSDSRSHETAASTPRSNPPSEMSSTTSTNFSNNPWCDPFDFGSTDPRKRFSNIELKSPFCTQLMQTQPKRYSNIETTTTTSKKRIENGNVIYDVSDTSKEKITSGDDQLDSKFLNGERDIREKFASDLKFGTAGSDHKTTPSAQQQPSTDAGKTDRKTYEQTSEQHESREEQHHSTKSFSQFFENRPKFSDETSASKEKKDDHFAYDEFRRRAKESAAERAKSEFLERQNYLLKDFDELTKLINEDLFHSDAESKVSKMSTTTTSTRAETADKTKFTDTSETTRGSVPTFADSGPKIPPTGGVRVFNVPINVTGDTKKTEEHFESKTHSETKEHKVYNIPIQVEGSEKKNEMPTRDQPQRSSEFPRSDQSKKEDVPRVRTVPIQIEGSRKQVPSSMPGSLSSTPTGQSRHQRERHLSERRLSSQNLDEWMRYIDDLGASSENITKPLQKEVGLCAFGRRANIRAPRITSEPGSNLTSRLSQSTSNLSTIGTSRDHFFSSHQFGRTNSLIDTTPISPFVTPRNVRRSSLPRELSDSQFEYIRQKEAELREEFDKLESDRRRLMEEMDQAHFKNRLRKDVLHHRSCRLPTLSEDEAFRQQMHDEWLDKVAEREERRLHKIVKISNTSDDIAPEVPSRNMKKAASTTNISDEFLRRVKERRSKLCLPSDSDWESGAESQPAPKREKDTTPPQVKVIEGQSERDFKNLPPHLREFAEITNQIIQQHYHDQETSSTEQRTTKTTSGSDVVKEEGRYPYKSNGYMSEPEPNYDSDYSTMKYHTLDRRRIPSTGSYQEERTYGTMPNPVRSSTGSYKNQPGRIENYVPGHSSVSDKEKKEWWDEVMDIFDGHLEQQKLSNNYTEGYLSRALKEDAYDSDSNLIFRKRQESHFAPLSPIEQKQAYRSVQAGGEPPLQGFRKSAPEKPKDDQEIEYYPITPTLTKIRVHTSSEKQKLPIPPPQQEIICYPITNISRPLDLFAPFPKNVPSFIPVNPPPPPCRKSSRSSTSLKVVSSHYSTSSGAGTSAKPIDARHEACFRSDYYQKESPSNKFGTLTIKKHVKHEPIVRSKSTGAVRSSSRLSTVVKEEKRPTGSTRISRKQLVRVRSVSPARLITRTTDLRKSSPSPVAFGRSISKERMFAEERKRLEQSLPLTRKSFTASTNILKDPALKSAEEVKKAVRTSYTLAKGGKTIPTSSRTASFVGSVTKRNIGLGKKEEENMRVSISSSSRGHESRKDTARVPLVTRASLHATQTSEKKTPKQSTKTSSTLSLARTSSTFSVDSSGSRKKDSKKPLTITRSASRDAATPRTISGRSKPKTKPPPKEIVASSKLYKRIEAERKDGGRVEAELKRELNNSIVEHHEAVRSDNFFQNLFLRDVSPGTSLTENEAQQSYSVLEKAHYWNTLSARSEPSLRRTSVYLSQRKPVSDSKFLTMESKHIHKSRSLSPSYRRSSSGGRVLEQVSKFDSIYQMSDDDESEFGDSRPGKMEELIYKYEQRSSSEPRTRTYLTEVIAPNSPTVIHGRQTLEYSRSVSPVTREIIRPPTREVRSPSRRRIDSLRESQRAETRRVIRASSLSSADDRPRHRIYANSELSHSTGSLNVIERHAAICRHRASHRFKDLNRFYRNLERVGQLERATSSTDLHPIRREGELIDFDVWKKVRAHEKAEKELTHLVDKLKVDQREKDLFFRPKDIADVKWNKRADSGLRCKEKSVEDLKEAFERKAHGEEFEEIRQSEISSSKDIYKPYWRGSSVVDSASSMTVKYNTQPKAATRRRDDPRLFLSNNLISTLSKDQVTKIKSQLSEIYSSSPGPSPKGKCEVKEDYIITVEEPSKSKVDSLKVRCNSSISKEELLGPILRKKEAQIRSMRSESLERRPSPPRPPAQSRTFERISREVSTRSGPELSEVEKKRLSFTISRELQDKVLEHKNRNLSPSLLARETRGAVAAENAKKSLPDPNAVREFISIEQVSQKQSQPQGGLSEERKTIRVRRSSGGESESNTSDISKTTVIYKGKQTDGILPKIKYFEEKKEEEPPKTIYHAREYSSPDEEEVLKAIEEKMKAREREGREKLIRKHTELSSSASDFRELFGERSSNFPVPPPPPPPDEKHEQPHSLDRPPYRSSSLSLSNGSSFESLFRSRSVSPTSRTYYRSYLNAIRTGDVRKMADKFETLNMPPRRNFFELGPPRRIRSDPELNSHVCKEGKSKLHKITVRDHESGDVSWITHKFEMKNSATRGRSRVRKTTSPIPRNPLRKEDRLMPHIDIISKTALLKEEMIKTRSPPRTSTTTFIQSGEVERIRNKFESPERTSLLGQMYTSSPDISQLRDISSYLNASWIAHKYPRRRDNARSPIFPEQGPESIEVKRRAIPPRPSSTSPPRAKSLVTSILKPYYDVFADQKFDPLIHRPISRYVPGERTDDVWNKVRNGLKKYGTSSAVTFEENDVILPPPPPPPPMKNIPMNLNFESGYNYHEESPRRYVEGDVNIHYKSPIRYEFKDAIPEEELARKQAESMKKLYQEERRRKYLQELEDMNNRRHTDNFIPSQKSPIPLNRYDDFPTDVSPKSPASASSSSNFSRTIARALYNFQGQSARELSFKKGDVIYIRRQIDKNWYEGEHNAMVGLLPVNYVEIITKDGSRPAPQKKPSEGQARAKYNFQAQSALELSLNKGELVTLTRRVDANWFEGKIANRKGIFPVTYVDVLTDIGADDSGRSTVSFGNSGSNKPTGNASSRTLITTNNISPTLDQLRTSLNNEFNHVTNGGQHPNGMLRETKTTHKTEVLHVDTNSEPIAYRAIYKYSPQNTDELELFEGDIVYVLEKCDDGWFVGTSQRTGQFGTFPGNYVERA